MIPTSTLPGTVDTPAEPPPSLRRVSPLMIITAILFCLGSVGAGLSIIATDGPVAALVSTLVASVSVPLLLFLILWLDRYEPEPTRYIIAAIGWGALGATTISLVVETLAAQAGFEELVLSAVIGPLIEEASKGIFLVLVILLRRRELDGILDGLVYASMVGLGFAFMENIIYYHTSYQDGGTAALTSTFILRGVFGPFAHPMFTAVFGIGFSMIIFSNRPKVRVLGPVLGFLGAFVLHGVWNGSSVYGGFTGYILTYFVGMLPILGVVITVAIWARRREADMLAFALDHCVGRGWIQPQAIPWVALLSNRIKARKWARENQGKVAARRVADYQQTLTELAFLYSRLQWGIGHKAVRERLSKVSTHAMLLEPFVTWPPESEADSFDIDEEFSEKLEDIVEDLKDEDGEMSEEEAVERAENFDEYDEIVAAAARKPTRTDDPPAPGA